MEMNLPSTEYREGPASSNHKATRSNSPKLAGLKPAGSPLGTVDDAPAFSLQVHTDQNI